MVNSAGAKKSDYIPERVLAIIGLVLLLGLLFAGWDVYRRCKATAYITACRTNLRDIRGAFDSYTKDHNGRYPSPEGWNEALKPYVKNESVLRCPAAKGSLPSYAMNATLAGKSVKGLKHPGKTVLVFESMPGRNLAGGPELLPKRARHFYCCVLYADGSITAYSAKNVVTLPAWGE